MSFVHRLATLAAVVAIPLGIAATSYVLTDAPEAPKVPPTVELSTSPAAGGTPAAPTPSPPTPSTSPSTPAVTPAPTTPPPPTDAVVPGPAATDDDEDDDFGDDG
ncbi:small hydrophilic protein [Streptomyces sp. NPDC006678]|uniref:small hydrophilic protein n=1 Tax=Streptomyces sp. NPDC006678 TaxID=3157185 RepID=UPI0033C56D91